MNKNLFKTCPPLASIPSDDCENGIENDNGLGEEEEEDDDEEVMTSKCLCQDFGMNNMATSA